MSMVWRRESSQMCLGCGQWLWYLLLLSVEYGSRFYVIILYILLSILSWPMIPTQYLSCTDPYLYLFSCYLWSAANVPTTSTRPQLQPDFSIIGSQGELLFLARTGFFPSRLDVLKFGHGPFFYLFQLLRYSQIQ